MNTVFPFAEASGSVPDFMPIQHRSVAFDYTTVLHCEGEASEVVPQFRPILLRESFFDFLQFLIAFHDRSASQNQVSVIKHHGLTFGYGSFFFRKA